MSTLISVNALKKTYGARPLFEDISFIIEEKERIGLIGPNGAGKSTLLKILSGAITADSGRMSPRRGLRIGFLEQTPLFTPDLTVLETVLEGVSEENWEGQALAHELLSKFSLEGEAPVDTLSGGWRKRVALARELAKQPDLLLLDEPTNHLDVESILWLEDFLSRSPFTTVTVTHDRLFLQRIANRILELDRRNPNGLLSVRGDYTSYLETKDQLMAAQERREIILKNTLRRETEWLRRGAKARTTKQVARIKRAGDLEEEVGELQTRNQSRTARFDFAGAEKNPKKLLEAESISKNLNNKNLFKNLSLILGPGTRLGLLGPNGCGKSTLIRILLKHDPADTGDVRHSDNLTVAYFEQNREVLDPELSVVKTLCPMGEHVKFRGEFVHIRSYLDRFLFTQEQMDSKIKNLSGGEQSRILIARLMLNPANLLVLDEPTNDLDMITLSVLEDCLKEFNGAVIFVTHDRYFLDQVATRILAFTEEGSLIPFVGIEQWESWQAEQKQVSKKPATKTPEKTKTADAPLQKKKLSFKEQNELDSMESNIHKAEQELERLTTESENPLFAQNAIRLSEITKAMAQTQSEIERLYARWSELAEFQKN